ncbi:toxic anion resistance protein [Streptococcus sanguinis]|jgi:toxic anion resistance family protein|uniref:Toxic anion resistance protein n=1 Tax=Streptococcus sanguinis TaxID=1305 RepID=A0ABD4VJM5_STRSA|nr:toxic anion resistance protein [Streptococcus sanguinis]MBZ2024912.1 toxic anion resistance protein [Streptococcus sanguinis]MCY7034351.1 toxic anion resistance protein [Streptococcus sanguinis]
MPINTGSFDSTPQEIESTELELAKPEVLADNLAYKQKLRSLPEVQNLTNEIDITNVNSIMAFGQKPSEGISQMSDALLSSMRRVDAEEASRMLVQLTKIMDKFDIKEIENPEKASALQKLFGKIKNSIDKLFAKYEDMGKEVDQIYTILKQYEVQIHQTQENLEKQYKTNVAYYEELEKYIVAGEIAQEEIQEYSNQIAARTDITEQEKQTQQQKLSMIKDMLAQRTYDLQIAENVAMQTCPMIQTMQMSNFNLMRKINSSFIITLPIFKQCLVQAIQLKRQEIQAKSIKQLDEKTNELLIRNAQNTANQSVNIARMAGGSSIQMETLRTTYETIKKGIEETKQINNQIAEKRKSDSIELEHMKSDMAEKGFISGH